MKINLITKKTTLLGLATLAIVSCSKEDENLNQIDDSISQTQITETEDPFKKGAFVYNERGEKISEEDFLKQNGLTNEPADYVTANKADFREVFNISSTDLNNNGMAFSQTRAVMDRYKRNNVIDKNYSGITRAGWEVRGMLVGCRPFGHSLVCNGNGDPKQSKWVLTRTQKPIFQGTKRISGPTILTSQEKKGWKNSPRRLGNQRLYEYKEKNENAVKRTLSSTITYGVKVGVKMSAGFLGTGSEFSTEFSFGGSLSAGSENSVTRGTERSTVVNFDDGNIVPKNQKCDFVLYGEQRRVTKRYQVKLGIQGGDVLLNMRRKSDGKTGTGLHRNGARYAFPDAIRQGKVKNNFDVTSTYWRYSIRRENCRRL